MDNGGKEAFTLNSNTKDAPERATNSEVRYFVRHFTTILSVF